MPTTARRPPLPFRSARTQFAIREILEVSPISEYGNVMEIAKLFWWSRAAEGNSERNAASVVRA
jgi:hypothetical protein